MTPQVRPSASVGQRVLAYVALLIGLVACGAAFWVDVQRVRTLGMDIAPPSWVVDAIPPALSAYLFGHRVRYTSLVTVHNAFTEGMRTLPGGVEAAMAEVATLDPDAVGTEYRLLGPDDKGIVDFVEAAFWIFGLKVQGITWLYLLVMLASVSALVIATGGSRAVMVWLVGFLLAHALLMPMIRLNSQLGSYLALRAMPVISMIACFHLLVFILRPSTRPLDLLLLALQALLIVLAVHIRVTAQWQIVAVGLVTLVVVGVRLYRGRGPSLGQALRRTAPVGLPLALLVLGMLGLQVYRGVAYPAEYQRGDQILTRVFWHNIISGLAFHPAFGERERLRVDDLSVMRAVGRFLDAQGRHDEWVAMGGETRYLVGLKFVPYEAAAREYLLHTCRTEPGVCLSTALYYKPRSLVEVLAWAGGLRADPPDIRLFDSDDLGDIVVRQTTEMNSNLRSRAQFAQPWQREPLLIWALVVVALALTPRSDGLVSLAAGLALLVGSLLTTIVGYPATWTIADPALATEALLYLVVGLAIAWPVQWLLRVALGRMGKATPAPSAA